MSNRFDELISERDIVDWENINTLRIWVEDNIGVEYATCLCGN